MLHKILLALAICIAITVSPTWGQRRGSAAAATVAERVRNLSIAAANSPDSPSLDRSHDDCVRKPMPAPVQKKKYGFSFSEVGSATQNNDHSILYKHGRAPRLLQFFGGGHEEAFQETQLPTDTFTSQTEDREWPIPKFPGCAVPSCVASEFVWNSPGIREATMEKFDLILAQSDVMKIHADIFNLGRDYNASIDNANACASFRIDFNDFKINLLGFGDKTSDDMQCIQHASGSWVFDCVSKKGRAMSAQAILSDKGSYVVFFQCWDSGEQTWSLYKRSESDYKLTPDEKWKVLRTVESLGFNACDYEIFDWNQCKHR